MRAQRPGVSEADRLEAERRALWHEGRARILSETLPRCYLPRPVYPPVLATPADRLHVVDELRGALAEVRELAAYLTPADLEAFVSALAPRWPRHAFDARSMLEGVEALSRALAGALGAGEDPFVSWEPPLVTPAPAEPDASQE